MTKMVTTVAALQLVEQGKIDLDAPVETYRPEFAELQVLEGFDGDTPRLRAPKRQATVRQLANHTSGLSYWFWNADIVRWEALTGTGNVLAGTADAFTAPLVADPGTKLEYGINTDWLGRVVEADHVLAADVLAAAEPVARHRPSGVHERLVDLQLAAADVQQHRELGRRDLGPEAVEVVVAR